MDLYERYKETGGSPAVLAECWGRYWAAETKRRDEFSWVHDELFDDLQGNPERVWQFILEAVRNPDCLEHMPVLAAGPVEDLLSMHGPSFIDRVESTARQDATFANVLGGVWRAQMSADVWNRVQRVWDRRGWDGIPAAP